MQIVDREEKMKFHKCLLTLLLLSIIFSGRVGNVHSESGLPSLINIFENGKLYLSGEGEGHFKILVLKGSWREMGRQYGYLLKEQMNDYYQTASRNLRMGYDQKKTESELIFNRLNKDIKEFIFGMAETSGFSLEKQKITCCLTTLIFLESTKPAGCSSLSVWGEYTGGRSLVIGRNWDYGDPFPSFKKFIAIVVYNPTGSPNSVAEVNFIGVLPCSLALTSLNSSGLYIDGHAGWLSDPTRNPNNSWSWYVNLFENIFNSTSINELEKGLLDPANRPSLGTIQNVVDDNECRVYEQATYGAKRRRGNGLMVSTNHFIDPGWTGLPDVPWGLKGDYSKERLVSLYGLGERYKGRIDAKRMMEIFDQNLNSGGATHDYTIFQVVTVPHEKIMWIKAPKFSQWDKIDLKPYFNLN
jgi:hypothetical protein